MINAAIWPLLLQNAITPFETREPSFLTASPAASFSLQRTASTELLRHVDTPLIIHSYSPWWRERPLGCSEEQSLNRGLDNGVFSRETRERVREAQ